MWKSLGVRLYRVQVKTCYQFRIRKHIFRCRTCAFNSCMSLCAECFEAGNHTGHDFNMFHSGAGGACDCGDSSVMDEKGICVHHQGRGP